MALIGQVVDVRSLTTAQRDRMYEILVSYFDGVTRSVFNKDLNEKDWAIILTDPDVNQLFGFSTLRLIEDVVDGIAIRAFFSGDTIIDLSYRARMTLEKTWIRFTLTHALSNAHFKYYWFLIVNSYRSFRYLPVYAKTYYPHPEFEMPDFERRLIDQLALKRYGDQYDPQLRVIRLKNLSKLRAGVGDIGEKELRDERIAFFQQRNPNWMHGVQLVCLTEISLRNANPVGMRIINELLRSTV
jgi:hypothetical protein